MDNVELLEEKKELSTQIMLKEEIPLILELQGKERMERILNSHNPMLLFQSLSEGDAYITIKEIGENDALALLSLMSPEQYQYLLDLELWRGYEFSPERVEHWLPILLSCDEEAIERWLRSIDLDTLLLILKKNIRIHIKDNDESLNIQKFFTVDGVYYIEILKPSLQNHIEQLLRWLAQLNLNLYWNLLDQVAIEIEAELEERALHFREARLEDKGFPKMEEALSLYQYMDPKRLRELIEKKEINLLDIDEEIKPSFYPLIYKDKEMFFSVCLKELDDKKLIDRIKRELAYMANQALVADRPESIDLETIKRGLQKVGGYLSIGLELLSEGDIKKALSYMSKIPLKYIFQLGFGASLELKWKAERIWKKGWFSQRGVPLSFLGYPSDERIRGLLSKKPLFFEEFPEGGFREFKRLEEIRFMQRELDRIELIGKILSSLPHFSYSEGLRWEMVILNAFLQEQIMPFNKDRPISIDEILNCIIEFRRGGKDPIPYLRDWIKEKVNFSDNEEALIDEIVGLIKEEIRFN